MMKRLIFLAMCVLAISVGNACADDVPNVDTPTFGGKQFWTDEFIYHDWRIQRQVLSSHYRLLDPENVRRAWGTFDQCDAEFARLKVERKLPPLKPRVVIVLHGLVRSRESMGNLCRYLETNGDFSVLNVSYASSREKVADHAKALARIVERLDGVQEINFVAHSLGNLVIRHYVGDSIESTASHCHDPRIKRIVMLAPPNQGTNMALRFKNNVLFQAVWGESGRELAETWPVLEPRLACPKCEFGVIAGGKRDENGFSPLLEGDDDFVVSVEETKLVGARDFAVLPVVHGAIMESREVHEQTLRFLDHGYFVSEQSRVPLRGDDATR